MKDTNLNYISKNRRIAAFAVVIILIAIVLYVAGKNFNVQKITKEEIENGQAPSKATSSAEIVFEDKNDFYEISAKVPNEPFDKNNVMKIYADSVIKNAQEEWKIGGEIWKGEKELKKDFPEKAQMKYQMNLDYSKVISEKNNSVTYIFQNYQFTGGAHGGIGIVTFTFNKDGEVKLENLLNLENNNDIKISKILSEKLKNKLGENSDAETIESGLGLAYLQKDGITLDKEKCRCDGFFFGSNLDKFILEDSGITFIFEQYQVAPYSSGIPEVTISFEELKDFLNFSPNLN